MNNPVNLRASLLDRLLDFPDKQAPGSDWYYIVSKRQILESVIRDLENLLNTRCSPIELPGSFKQLKESLIRYGLGDFTTENPESSLVRQKLCMEIEKSIAMFEPRLKKVIVRIEKGNHKARRLFFRISGVLAMEPLEEPVAFDTFFDLNRRQYIIAR